MVEARMQGIFVSYRRQDSQSAAGRLSDHLKEHLAGVPIFRDVETIEPGVDFLDAIGRALQSCGVLIAVIGPRWASITDDKGLRRLEDPNDYTRLEIATALKREGVRVIPVLVDGASVPSGDALPPDLQSLVRRNAIELSDKRWEYDVSQLVNTLRSVLAIPDPVPEPTPEPAPVPKPPAEGRETRHRYWIVAAVVVLAVIGYAIEEPLPTDIENLDPLADVTQSEHDPDRVTAVPDLPAGVPLLTGLWHDNEGGRYEISQQGNQLIIQGMSPDGYVAGSAVLQGSRGEGAYTLNGHPLQSSFVVSPDGTRMEVAIRDPASGQSDFAVLQKIR
ncbi:MAG: hypothetical protein C0607_22710 [Azoarcus sp.]|nr:MAG: hypothetical protein C0607_22710 [Azoarcus sp.]